MLPPAGYFCLQRQKYPKTPLETTFQDFLGALRPVSNLPHVPRVIGFSRVPLSVKRTVPPQLSATASLQLPRATAAASSSTAVPGERDERRGFPRRFAPRNDNVRGLYNEILAAQRAAPTFCGALHRKRRDLIIATPHRERVSKGRGRARPFPLDASLHSAAAGKSNPAGRQNKRSPAGGGASINSE